MDTFHRLEEAGRHGGMAANHVICKCWSCFLAPSGRLEYWQKSSSHGSKQETLHVSNHLRTLQKVYRKWNQKISSFCCKTNWKSRIWEVSKRFMETWIMKKLFKDFWASLPECTYLSIPGFRELSEVLLSIRQCLPYKSIRQWMLWKRSNTFRLAKCLIYNKD